MATNERHKPMFKYFMIIGEIWKLKVSNEVKYMLTLITFASGLGITLWVDTHGG